MSNTQTYAEIAENYGLWGEYIDTGAEMTEAEFDTLTVDERIAIIVECMGKEQRAGE